MNIKGQICVVTGAGGGIGRALAVALAENGASYVVCADVDLTAVEETAHQINGLAQTVDVGKPEDILTLIDSTERDVGPIGLFASNAGIVVSGGTEVPDAEWQRIWDVNVMSHVWAARALVPLMTARGGGYLLNTASAAGLLNMVGAAPYGVTKHAAVGLAEWLSITHHDAGIRVSLLCPQAVDTDMLRGLDANVAAIDGILSPEDVAQCCIDAIGAERFLVLPHAHVHDYMQLKAADYERWLSGMRQLQRRFGTQPDPGS